MSENENSIPRGNLRGIPYNDQSKQPGNRRGTKSAHDNRKRVSAARIESNQYAEDNSPREYNADDLNEAVIWVRELDPNDTDTKPLITNRRDAEKQESYSSKKSAHKTKETEAIEPKTDTKEEMQSTFENATADDPSVGYDRSELNTDLEPAQPMERAYFWNQTDARQAPEHGVLPSIDSQVESSKNAPALEYAVNPNEGYHGPSYHAQPTSTKRKKSGKQQKNGFITRRLEKRAVKSQAMEGDSFERTAPAVPFSEFAPATEDIYTEPVQLTVESVEQRSPAGPGDDYIDSPTEYNYARKHAASSETRTGYKQEKLPRRSTAERALVEHSLERTEQLEIARSISIDGVSVYEMFVARRIDETGLHNIIVEYLRGGDLRDVIKNEIIRQQLKFERDPQLRNKPISGSKGSSGKIKTSIKGKAKSVASSTKPRDTTEKFAELAQLAIEKSHEYLDDNPKKSQMVGVVAIVVIYVTILIVALAK